MKQNHTIREIIHELEARVRSNRRWRVVATCLASVVVFTTVYLLVLPAITMETSDDLDAAGIENTAEADVEPLVYDPTSGEVTSGDADAVFTEPDSSTSTGQDASSGDTSTSQDDAASVGDAEEDQMQDGGSQGDSIQSGQQTPGAAAGDDAGDDPSLDDEKADNENTETQAPTSDGAGIDALADESDSEVSATADVVGTVVAEGTLQSNDIPSNELTWKVIEDDRNIHTLIVSGKGTIPDYDTTNNRPPWFEVCAGHLDNIIIEEGITTIGQYAFDNLRAKGSLTLPDGLTTIRTGGFQTNIFTEGITVPGTVTRTEDGAFGNNSSIPWLRFEKHPGGAAQFLGLNALSKAFIADPSSTLYIPSTMTQLGSGNMRGIASTCHVGKIVVEGDNPNYFTQDGVLYSYEDDNKDTWCLERFPPYLEMDTYTLPDKVVRIEDVAFQYTRRLREVVIPDKTDENAPDVEVPVYLFYQSWVQNVTIGDRAVLADDGALDFMFNSATQLQYAELPETLRVKGVTGTPSLSMSNTYAGSNVLVVNIPKEVTSIGTAAFQGTTNLNSVTYNAADVKSFPAGIGHRDANNTESRAQFDLTIGADVDHLAAGFNVFSCCAQTVTFEGPNVITVDEGAFDGMPIPLRGLSGTLYIDDEGLVYLLDDATHEVTFVYCPPRNNATVVGSITVDGDASPYTVTGVRQNSLAAATGLRSLTFDDSAAITRLDQYALGNCPTLTSINGKTVEPQIQELFKNAQESIDDTTFYNTAFKTGLSGRPFVEQMQGGASLTVNPSEGTNAAPLQISVLQSSSPTAVFGPPNLDLEGLRQLMADSEKPDFTPEVQGGWYLLTGATLKAQAQVGNTTGTSDHVYRVFVRKTTSQASLSWQAGDKGTYGAEVDAEGNVTKEGTTVYCHPTDDPYVVCLEFKVAAGSTLSIPIDATYPSPTSAGGGLLIWGEIIDDRGLTPEGEPISINLDLENDETWQNALYAYWMTNPDWYDVTMSTVTENVDLAGDGDGEIHPASGITWSIKHDRVEATTYPSYGKDYITSYTVTDKVTLPAGVNWDDGVIQGIENGEVSYFTTQESGSWYVTHVSVGGVEIATISSYNDRITSFELTLDESTNVPVFKWTNRNTSGTPVGSEAMSVPEHQFTLLPEALVIDEEAYNPEASSIINTAHSQMNYHWNDAHTSDANSNAELGDITSILTLDKTVENDPYYFGEDINYTVSLKNVGADTYEAAEVGSYTLVDQVDASGFMYVKPENIQELFQNLPNGVDLEVTISDAELKGWTPVADAIADAGSDTKAYITPNNTTGYTDDSSHTVTIKRGSSGTSLEVLVDGKFKGAVSPISSEGGLASQLKIIGYDVTRYDKYVLTWTLNPSAEKFTMAGNQAYEFRVTATAKSTFELLGADWPNQYPLETTLSVTNRADLYDQNGKTNEGGSVNQAIKTDSVSTTLHREAIINKEVYNKTKGGEDPLTGEFSVDDGDVLQYQFDFTHYGSSAYDNLPFVDDMYGAQALLVPVAGNDELSDDGLDRQTIDEVEYYVLKELGTYKDVLVGVDDEGRTWTAATIEVTGEGDPVTVGGTEDNPAVTHEYEGLHTQISWYHAELPGDAYKITLSYNAVVLADLDEDGSYDIGNIIWANDKEEYRIYDAIWGGGSIISFDKNIISSMGNDDTADDDTLATAEGYEDGKYSLVDEGDSVTYRITLTNKGNAPLALSGANLADALPDTYNGVAGETFTWEKGTNVSISNVISTAGEGEGATTISEGFFKNAWSIKDTYLSMPTSPGQQFIVWDDSAYIDFAPNSSVYIYITLKYPNNDKDKNVTEWTDYVDAADGTMVQNSLWVYRFSTQVNHELFNSGSVVLAKGVYNTGIYNGYYNDRHHFSTYDARDHTVTYYVALVNAGSKRLYLNTLYDVMPEGFWFRNVKPAGDINQTQGLYTIEGNTRSGQQRAYGSAWPEGMNYTPIANIKYNDPDMSTLTFMSAGVTATANDATHQLTFSFSEGSGDYAVRYDEDYGKYYLAKGEAIVFAYTLNVGTQTDVNVPDTAVNSIYMPYDDYQGSGVVAADDPKTATAQGVHVDVSGYLRPDVSLNTTNDGKCTILTKNEGELPDGVDADVAAGESSEYWLSSKVTVEKGNIQPDLTKEATSYTSVTGDESIEIEPGEPIDAKAAVQWEVRAYNDGMQNMSDYVIADTLPQNYVFVGDVFKTTHNYNDGVVSSNDNVAILTIGDHDANVDTVQVTAPSKRNWDGVEVDLDRNNWSTVVAGRDEHGWYNTYSDSIKFRLYRNDNGQEVLEIRFIGIGGAIPENGGYAKLVFSSKNGTTDYPNTVYTNNASVRLFEDSEESWDNPDEGSLEDYEGHKYVTNSSFINVSSGLGTKAENTVTEDDTDPANTAVSTTSKNTIQLGEADNTFTYTLEVNNTTEHALDKLVIIDALPAVGDTDPFSSTSQRGSEYNVDFVLGQGESTPTMSVVVEYPNPHAGEEGQPDTLTETLKLGEQYTVGYQNGTAFTDEDWAGDNDGTWGGYTQGDRTFRIELGGTNGYKLPEGAIIRVSFKAKAEDGAVPGSTAWNNFGYHYELTDGVTSQSLSAMSLDVGVQVPAAPELKKLLVDDEGQPLKASEDMDFTFVVYEGEPLPDEYATKDELIEALAQQNPVRNYRVVTVPVKRDETESDVLYLTKSYMNGGGVKQDGQADWAWIDGGAYTIVEVGAAGGLTFKDINNSEVASYRFTYNATRNVELAVTNEETIWTLNVHKVDGNATGTNLEGAVFALYSLDQSDELSEQEYADLVKDYTGVGVKREVTFTDATLASHTGYLVAVGRTDNGGALSFAELERDSYYLLEVQAPDGYNLPDIPGTLVSRDEATAGVLNKDIQNFPGYDLPSTGGPGTTLFTLGGVALMGAACIAGYRKRSRKGDGPCC